LVFLHLNPENRSQRPNNEDGTKPAIDKGFELALAGKADGARQQIDKQS